MPFARGPNRCSSACLKIRSPVAREFLHRREPYALGLIRDGLLFGPLRVRDASAQLDEILFRNEERAPLLFIAGSEDNIMPPAVNQSNVKHYRHVKSVTDYKEFPGRSHYTLGQDGWEEVADYALEWAEANATRPAA